MSMDKTPLAHTVQEENEIKTRKRKNEKNVCLFVVCVASGNLRLRTYLRHAEMRVGRCCRCAPCIWAECTKVCLHVRACVCVCVCVCMHLCMYYVACLYYNLTVQVITPLETVETGMIPFQKGVLLRAQLQTRRLCQ